MKWMNTLPSKGVIAFTGSGGKTTLLYQFAEKQAAKGKKVIVTTTTKMAWRRDCVIALSAEQARQELTHRDICVVGRRAENPQKMCGLGREELERLIGLADYVLVEADGSRRMPFKIPADYEPVIPKQTNQIVHVIGACAVGQPIGRVCHRWELARQWIPQLQYDTILTREMMEKCYENSYQIRFQQEFPHVPVCVIWNQF